MKYTIRCTIFICCFFLVKSNAQDLVYSQFFSAPLQLNPGFTGRTYSPFIAINHRRQWPGIVDGTAAYVTSSVSYDQFFKNLNSGFGVTVMSDNSGGGIIKKNTTALSYGYRLKIVDEMYIKLGVEAGLSQNRLDWNQLLFYDQLDPINGPGSLPTNEIQPENLSRTYFDVSTGFLLYSPRFYAGLTFKHLNTPDEGFLKINDNLFTGLPMRVNIHAGTEIILDKGNNRREATFISPNILISKQGDFAQVDAGIYGNIRMVLLGASYRHTFGNADAVIAMVGVKEGVFKMIYSYDVTVSDLTLMRTGGSHEISLIFNFDALRPRGIDYNDCMNLFR